MSQYLLTFLGVDSTTGAKAMPMPSVSGAAVGDTFISATIITGDSESHHVGDNVTGVWSAVRNTPPASNIVIDGVANATFNYIVQSAGTNLNNFVILALMQRP